MAIGTRSWARSSVFSGGLPPGIKWLLITNTGIFLLDYFVSRFAPGGALAELFSYLPLIPAAVVKLFFVWQLVTYMFLHSGISHILWNMLALWMFGVEFERLWGTRRFLQFYFFCGVGAGVCVVVANYLFGNPAIPTVGSSGAIYGLLLASAVLWPDRQILFSFLIPIKMKYFVMIIGAISFLNSFNSQNPVSEFAHLGGMLFGYIFLKMPRQGRRSAVSFSLSGSLRDAYRQWKIARAKRKFEVYMRKQKSDRDNWVNEPMLAQRVQTVLDDLEKWGRENDRAQTDRARTMRNLERETAQLVRALIVGRSPQRMLEIGTSNGYSTIWLAASLAASPENAGRLITIDVDPEKHRLARENLEGAGLDDRVELMTGDATEIVAKLEGPFDVVFFDADRFSAPAQLALLVPKLSPSALLLADNVTSHPAEIAGYLAAIRLLPDFEHTIVPVGKGLSVAFRGA